jgi:hypothetical protein
MAQVVDGLCSKHEALSSIPSTTKRKKEYKDYLPFKKEESIDEPE